MKFREFLKGFLKSAKSGRIHSFLKLSLIALFLFFSYRVSVSVVDYWVRVKAELSVVKKNFNWDFNWRTGELSLKADYLFLKNPRFSGEFYRPEIDLSVYRSLKELRSVVLFVGFDEGRVVVEGGGGGRGKGFRIPVVPERFRIGRLMVRWSGGELHLNRLVYDGKSFLCGGVSGEFKGREFFVEPFSGFRRNGKVVIPSIVAGLDGSRVSGTLEFSGLDRWLFSGSVFSGVYIGQLVVKNYGKFELQWKGKTKGIETAGKGIFSFGKHEIEVKKVVGKFDGADFKLWGTVSEELSLEGRVKAQELTLGSNSVKGLNLKVKCTGKLKNPSLQITGRAAALKSSILTVKGISVRGRANFREGSFSLESRSLNGELHFNRENGEIKGKIRLKRFSLLEIVPVSLYRKRYGLWVPGALLTGNVEFSLKGKELSYCGKLNVDKFNFQSFKGSGDFSFEGNVEKLRFRGSLRSENGGEVYGEGNVYLKEKRIESSYRAVSVPAEQFGFLKKVGLKGKVSGSGRVYGLLKNPEADFTVSSSSLYFRGVELGAAEGELRLKNYILSVSAVSERGTLEKLKLRVKGKMELSAEGRVREITGGEAEKLLESFKVKLPFTFGGTGSGSFSVYSSDIKKGENLKVNIGMEEFRGRFSYGDLEVKGTARGSVSYLKGKVFSEFSGSIDEAFYKEKRFKGGKFSVSLNGEELNVSVKETTYDGGFDNSISTDLFVNLKSGELHGRGTVDGSYRKAKLGEVAGSGSFSFSGFVSQFTVKFSGKLNLNSKLIGRKKLNVDGSLLEPQNIGTVSFTGDGTDLKVIVNGESWHAVGVVRKVNVKTEKAKIKVNMAFVNLNLNSLTGSIAVPAFKVFPEGFYPLYSISGLYINVKNGKPEVSDFTLSYVDGWLKFKKVKLDGETSGEFEARVGLKGLVYLMKAQKFFPYARNGFRITGNFRYGREFHYKANIDGNGVEFRVKYLLDRAVINSLKAVVEDNQVEEISGEISAGSGTIFISGKKEELGITASMVPVGEVGKWKGLISGKAEYGEKGVKGTLTVSKAKLFLAKEEKKSSGEGNSPKLNIPVDVDVLFDQPLKIKGELFSLTLVPSLKVKTLNDRVVIGGTFYVTDGKINYMGKDFKVIYGTGNIEDLEKKKGRVSILASAYVSGYYIYMKIEGEFSNLTIYLTSDPPLTREQILNLIMTGASPEEIEASSELFPAVQVAYYATASLFKPFEAKFKKTLRLESFSIEPYITKYGETVAKLTVAKRLAERIRLIGYGTTGQNPEYGGSVQLFLKKNYYLELRYNSYYGAEAGIGLEVNKR